MMIEGEFIGRERSLERNRRLVLKPKDDISVTDLIPTLYDMAKIMMRIQCGLDKTSTDEKLFEEFSKMESAIMKMALDVECMRRKSY
ncbi:MAG: hypothetical protein ACRDFB_04870 [Rhabdochlamydiaceae bacterium]